MFYKEAERTQAAICLIDQGEFAFFYISVSSRTPEGMILTTWNYPFSYSLKLHPHIKIQRVNAEFSFMDVHDCHAAFLLRNNLSTKQLAALDPTKFPDLIQHDLKTQITHNLSAGVLKPSSEGEVRYSWRGFLFLWIQFLRDFVRFS